MFPFSHFTINMFFSSLPLFPAKQVSMTLLIMPLLFSLIAICFAKLIHYIFNTRNSQILVHKEMGSYELPPGPKPMPFIGNLAEMLISKILTGQPTFRWILGLLNQFDTDIACVRVGNVHVIPVRSPEIACEFLRKKDSLFASRPLAMTTECCSGGYLSTATVPEGEQWKKMRKLLSSHIFNPSKLHFLRPMIHQEADNLVRFVYNQCKDSNSKSTAVLNIRLLGRQFCGNVIRSMLFGQRYFGRGREDGGPGFEEVEHVDSAFKVLSHIYAFSLSDYVPYLRLLDLDGHGKIVSECMKTINKYHHPIVEERVKLWRAGNRTEAKDMLDLLILAKDSNGQHLSTEEIKAQCSEFVLATVDNPSNAVEWALAEMINQPEILRKAIEEIDEVVGKERLVQESDLSSLPYVKACVREAFRLHPIAPFNLPHVSTANAVVSGYFIPRGSHILLSRVELGRNPKVWDEPLKFNPDRHLQDDNAGVEIGEPDLRFISFSTGRRGCPAVRLGSIITLMLLSRILQGFTLDVPPGKSEIDLSESENDLSLSQSLHVLVKPRLLPIVYLPFP